MTGNQALPVRAALPGSPISAHDATGAGSIFTILKDGDIVTGVRGTTDGTVILTGSQAKADGTQDTMPFLYQGPLTSAAQGAEVSVLTPPFPGFQTGTFYGPDTNTYNPDLIPAGQVRAVGSYRTSSNGGVLNHGMIYLGPVNGSDGQWTTIDVPADGSNTVGHVRACPETRPGGFVMDTIAHSTDRRADLPRHRPRAVTTTGLRAPGRQAADGRATAAHDKRRPAEGQERDAVGCPASLAGTAVSWERPSIRCRE